MNKMIIFVKTIIMKQILETIGSRKIYVVLQNDFKVRVSRSELIATLRAMISEAEDLRKVVVADHGNGQCTVKFYPSN